MRTALPLLHGFLFAFLLTGHPPAFAQTPGPVYSLDSAGMLHGIYVSFHPGYRMADSGRYEHGSKTGYWVTRNDSGKLALEQWFVATDSIPVRTIFHFRNGKKISERFVEPQGVRILERNYSSAGSLETRKTIFQPPRYNIAGIAVRMTPEDSIVRSVYVDGAFRDSVFGRDGHLRSVNTAERKWSYYHGGKLYSYNSPDTTQFFYLNGSPRAFFANLPAVPSPESKNAFRARTVTRFWAEDDALLSEAYEYQKTFPKDTLVLGCDDQGRLAAEGRSDANGLKHGQWKFYRYTAAGARYCSEEGAYEHGSRTGAWKSWYENGALKSEIAYVTGKQTTYALLPKYTSLPRGECDRLIIEAQDKKHVTVRTNLISSYKSFYPDGKPRTMLGLRDDGVFDGEWKSYGPDGRLVAFDKFAAGKRVDSAFCIYPSGKICVAFYPNKTNFYAPDASDPRDSLYAAAPMGKLPPLPKITPDNPLFTLLNYCDGLGERFSGADRDDYKMREKYREAYQSDERIERPQFTPPWVKPYVKAANDKKKR